MGQGELSDQFPGDMTRDLVEDCRIIVLADLVIDATGYVDGGGVVAVVPARVLC